MEGFFRKVLSCTSIFIVVLMFIGCGASNSAGTNSMNVKARLANTNLIGVTAQSSILSLSRFFSDPGSLSFAAGDSASSTLSSLSSLKYIFGGMQICESLDVNGSAFNGGVNCISLYSSTVGDPTTITQGTFPDYSSQSTDLMDLGSISSFNNAASGKMKAGSYNYVTVNWAPYISVKGSVPIGGTTLRTQSCTVDTSNGMCKSSTSLASAVSDSEAIVKSANGGSWFKFQNPFVISADDVSHNTQYIIDMVFNPEGAIAGSKNLSPGGGFYYGQISDVDPSTVAGDVIYVPMIQLTPVPRKSSDTVSKETYHISLPANAGTARLELYYIKSDSNKTVYGVNLMTLLTSTQEGSATSIDYGSKISTMTTDSDGKLTLKFTDGTAVVEGLTRGTDSTVNINYLGGISSSTPVTAAYVDTVDLK